MSAAPMTACSITNATALPRRWRRSWRTLTRRKPRTARTTNATATYFSPRSAVAAPADRFARLTWTQPTAVPRFVANADFSKQEESHEALHRLDRRARRRRLPGVRAGDQQYGRRRPEDDDDHDPHPAHARDQCADATPCNQAPSPCDALRLPGDAHEGASCPHSSREEDDYDYYQDSGLS